jgi:hypothetical protein
MQWSFEGIGKVYPDLGAFAGLVFPNTNSAEISLLLNGKRMSFVILLTDVYFEGIIFTAWPNIGYIFVFISINSGVIGDFGDLD